MVQGRDASELREELPQTLCGVLGLMQHEWPRSRGWKPLLLLEDGIRRTTEAIMAPMPSEPAGPSVFATSLICGPKIPRFESNSGAVPE